LITKRGENRPADREEEQTIDIAQLAQYFMAWHCQRPNIAHNQNQLFDKHFERLFKADYPPPDVAALHFWATTIQKGWNNREIQLEESLFAYGWSKYHLLYAVQLFLPSQVISPTRYQSHLRRGRTRMQIF
jgi:hypothetical protein